MTDVARTQTAKDGETPLDTTEAVQVAAFRAVLRKFLRASEKIARANGLTPRTHQLLLMIKGARDGSEQATTTELARRLQLAQSTVTELVTRAEQTGLVVRERSSADLRVAHVRLTAEGERRLARSTTTLAAERHRLRLLLDELDSEPA